MLLNTTAFFELFIATQSILLKYEGTPMISALDPIFPPTEIHLLFISLTLAMSTRISDVLINLFDPYVRF